MASNSSPAGRKTGAPEKKYKCQFCNRAFSRSEHRSRHERSRKCPLLAQRRYGSSAWLERGSCLLRRDTFAPWSRCGED